MRVAVIGGGAAGLACARALVREGLVPVVFERREALGGVWHPGPSTDPFAPPMYDGLRTNLPAEVMAFREHPFTPSTTSPFVHHTEVRAYLDGFARAFDLHRFVRLGSNVQAVRRHASGWVVQTPSGHERFDALAVCNGHYAAPLWPELPGRESSRIRISHSRTYRTPAAFESQRVAVLGAKASGVDIALELRTYAASVVLCGRDFESRLPPSKGWPVTRRPAITALAGENNLVLADGTVLENIDSVVCCTGYRYAFEFLPAGLVDTQDGSVGPLHLDVLSTREASVGFIGLPSIVVPFPLFEVQSRWLAQTWSGRLPTPSSAEIAREQVEAAARRAAAGVPHKRRLRYGNGGFDQFDRLADLCKTPRFPEALRESYANAGAARRERPATYRDD